MGRKEPCLSSQQLIAQVGRLRIHGPRCRTLHLQSSHGLCLPRHCLPYLLPCCRRVPGSGASSISTQPLQLGAMCLKLFTELYQARTRRAALVGSSSRGWLQLVGQSMP